MTLKWPERDLGIVPREWETAQPMSVLHPVYRIPLVEDKSKAIYVPYWFCSDVFRPNKAYICLDTIANLPLSPTPFYLSVVTLNVLWNYPVLIKSKH